MKFKSLKKPDDPYKISDGDPKKITKGLYFENKDILRTVQNCDLNRLKPKMRRYLKESAEYVRDYEQGKIDHWYNFFKGTAKKLDYDIREV